MLQRRHAAGCASTRRPASPPARCCEFRVSRVPERAMPRSARRPARRMDSQLCRRRSTRSVPPALAVGHDTLSRMQGIPEWGVRPSTAGERSVLTRAPCHSPVRRDGGPHQGRLHKRGRARECLATSPVSRGQRTSQATKACTRLRQAAFRRRCFVCVQDIYTGDFVDIYVITKDGTAHEVFELKKD